MTWKSSTAFFLILWAMGFCIALAIPDRPLEIGFLHALVLVVGSIIPAVRQVASQSPIQDIAQVYWAVMCIWTPLWLPLFFKLTDEQVIPLERALRQPLRYALSPLVAILVFVCVIFMPFGPGTISGRMLGSVWGLALIASALFAGVPLFIRAFVAWLRYVPIVLKNASNWKR